MGFRASTCAELSIHAPMAPPHFQGSVGGGTSRAQRISWMLPKKPSKLSCCYALNFNLQKIVFLLLISSEQHGGAPPQAGPPGAYRAVPPDVRVYTSTLQRRLPLLLPSTCVKADVFLHCLTTPVMGGNGLSRPGGAVKEPRSQALFPKHNVVGKLPLTGALLFRDVSKRFSTCCESEL